jgi:nucleoside phosphorylase
LHSAGNVYEVGEFRAASTVWDVLVCEIGAGNVAAATEAERAINFFRPQVALFVGVAGGLKDVQVGDVVVSSDVFSLHSGKAGEEFRPRPNSLRGGFRLIQRAKANVRRGAWIERLKLAPPDTVPNALVGPIVAGEQVVSSTLSESYKLARESYSHAVAVEMEGFGFMQAGWANPEVEAVVIRGISDLIDDKNDSTDPQNLRDDVRQRMAARHASAFAFEMLATFETTPRIGFNNESLTEKRTVAPPQESADQPLFLMPVVTPAVVKPSSSSAILEQIQTFGPADYVTESVHSSLLAVVEMPQYIYGAPVEIADSDPKKIQTLVRTIKQGDLYPFTVRAGMLWCFHNLSESDNAFSQVIQHGASERYSLEEWCKDSAREAIVFDLLNRALNKLTGRRTLNFDRDRRRYFFQALEPSLEREITYLPMNQGTASRKVVWSPKKKRGGHHPFWYNRAVSLRFHHVEAHSWCLSVRPSFHITLDGIKRHPDEKMGRKITKKMARMFNYDLLGEVHFWSDYLRNGRSLIVLPFGDQSVQISPTLLPANVRWPGIPEEHAKQFRNTVYDTDIFTQFEIDSLKPRDNTDSGEDDLEDWELE